MVNKLGSRHECNMLFLLMILNMYLPLGNWLIFTLYNRCIQNPVKHLRRSFFDIWLGSELPLLIYTGKKHYIWFQTALAHLKCNAPIKKGHEKKQSTDVLCKLTATSLYGVNIDCKGAKKKCNHVSLKAHSQVWQKFWLLKVL